MIDSIRDFLRLETAAGVVLFIAAALAMVAANTPVSGYYSVLIDMPVEIRIGEFAIAKPLLLWVNDGLMAIFFFLIGLELKREIYSGQLSSFDKAILPGLGAIGGMLVPSLIFAFVNWGDAANMRGWAIPAATDIAFALAILNLLGDRVPSSLKIFLMTVAIFDDIGAILIIALFYAGNLSVPAMLSALACLVALFALNRRGVVEKAPYIIIGIVMWVSVLKSGVHATLAGVALAMFIPVRDPAKEPSPLHDLEHDLHTAVAFIILPVFAFCNAGIPFTAEALESVTHPVTIGIMAGLVIGKPVGVLLLCWLGTLTGLAKLPPGMTWSQLIGIGFVCGIGFTMSLFIGSLAYPDADFGVILDERVGVLAGSLVAGALGYMVLRLALPAPKRAAAAESPA